MGPNKSEGQSSTGSTREYVHYVRSGVKKVWMEIENKGKDHQELHTSEIFACSPVLDFSKGTTAQSFELAQATTNGSASGVV